MKKIFAVLLPFSIGLLFQQAHGASGASFLKLGVGARSIAMGSAYTAAVNDTTALFWNPAALSRLEKREASAHYAQLYSDVSHNFVAYAQPGNRFSWGAGALYLTQGKLEGRGENRESQGSFSASDVAITMGLAGKITPRSSLGASLKIIRSEIAAETSNGFAFDLGYQSKLSAIPASLGVSVLNLGPDVKFVEDSNPLPLTVSAGVSYTGLSRLILTAEGRHFPNDSNTSFNMGAEFTPFSMISLRSGYATNTVQTITSGQGTNAKLSQLNGMGLGVGLKLGPGTLDYTFAPAGELGETQRVSLKMNF